MDRDEVMVRPAVVADVASLVDLRVANAEVHLLLDPEVYRIPERIAVARHFRAVLAAEPAGHALLVAQIVDRLVGMVEVVRNPEPPDHQILRPDVSAQVHTVVAEEARDRGVGSALLGAAEQWAAAHGIGRLSAGIHHRNVSAVRFYERHGYADSGRSLTRQL
jgi:GNAT superfamily N-acetyltransferase